MSKELGNVELEGTVIDALGNGIFDIKIDEVGKVVRGHLSGKMRMNKIMIVVGDRVKVQVSPYDINKGRIVYRNK